VVTKLNKNGFVKDKSNFSNRTGTITITMTDSTTVWMCQIETNDRNHGWRLECTYPTKTQPKANLVATRIIVKDLWEDLYTDIPVDDNDIIDKLAYTEQEDGGKYVTTFHNDDDFIEDIRVSIWEETVLE